MKQDDLYRYLLNDPSLDEKKREQIETEYLADDETYERMLAIEDEVVDAFALGKLRGDREAQVGSVLSSSPGLQRKLTLSELLIAHAGATPAVHFEAFGKPKKGLIYSFRSHPALVATAACTGVMLIAFWIYYSQESFRPRKSGSVEIAVAKPPSSVLPRITEKAPALAEPKFSASTTFTLSPSLVRSTTEQTHVTIKCVNCLIGLRLRRGNDGYSRYWANVSAADGKTVANLRGVRASGHGSSRSVLVGVRARVLTPDVYVINLKGSIPGGPWEDLDYYTFQVVRH